jgi:hypothetical protein
MGKHPVSVYSILQKGQRMKVFFRIGRRVKGTLNSCYKC